MRVLTEEEGAQIQRTERWDTSSPASKPEFDKDTSNLQFLIVHRYMYTAQRRPCKGYAACRLSTWYTAPQRSYKQRHSTERGIAYYGRK